ncbi:hypothetical protein K7X08_037985 [Anisodus acutangulus]|uniref:GRF-type domain-containing protein n=1 Tax=Anisodus acutangulus TaxID=402998 RepID=A0A9Q1N1X2_9SOLA|nr:hypothetical protein K7X08_037985 [Anisodus acutangulus]
MSQNLSSNTYATQKEICMCGDLDFIRISKTPQNPKREFYGCAKGNKEYGGCGYFRWVDDDTPVIREEKFNLLHMLYKAEESLGEVRSLFLEAEASRDWFKDQMKEA